MADLDHHDLSAHTETRTQRSPNRQRQTNRTDIDFEGFRMKEEFRREVDNCHRELEILKEELYHKNEQIDHLNGTVILKLKQELNDAHKQKIRHFQESERTRKEVEKLRNDNYSMQQELERNLKERKTYFSKMEELKELKEATKRELFENEKIIKNYSDQNRKLEKQVATLKMDIEEISEDFQEKDKKMYETDSEYKIILQRNFVLEAEMRNLTMRQKDNEIAINTYREKINELERQREDLLDQIEEQDSGRFEERSPRNEERDMMEIQSLMKQIYLLIEEKGRGKETLSRKFQSSISAIEKTLLKK